MKTRSIVLSLLLVTLFIAACSPPPVLRDDGFLSDTSLLTDDPCEAPCWRGIIPGETVWRDARIIVEDDPQFTGVELVEDEQSDARLLTFSDSGGPQCCQVFSGEEGDVVNAILTLLAPDMTLGEIIDKYGDPAYAGGGDVTPDQTLVLLIYPDVPLVLYVFAAGVETGELTADSEVIGAIYMTDDVMDELLATTDLYDWEGYQPLAGYFDENFDYLASGGAEATDEAPSEDEAPAEDAATEDDETTNDE